LSLHDALPISAPGASRVSGRSARPPPSWHWWRYRSRRYGCSTRYGSAAGRNEWRIRPGLPISRVSFDLDDIHCADIRFGLCPNRTLNLFYEMRLETVQRAQMRGVVIG